MKSFQWTEDYLTGLPDVDSQHHKLVDLINQFGESVIENELDIDDIDKLTKDLTAYTHYHFQEEESMMREIGIDHKHYNYHKTQHESFIQHVVLMIAETQSNAKTDPRQLLDFLTQWLAYHILGVDQDMAEQLRAIQAGTTPEEAYLEAKTARSKTMGPLLSALTSLFQLLTERNKALMELNRTLESKVQERTLALTEANIQLEKFAMTDVLTELPNRRYAMTLLRQLWTEHASIVCMMIDADGFKQINDKYGHDSGDVVLKALALELKHSVRTDDFVCRLGGDEFLIICIDTPFAGAMHLAEMVRKAVAALNVPAGEGLWHGSISVGVAVRTAAMETPDELLKTADNGVYMSKGDGRNCVRSCQTE